MLDVEQRTRLAEVLAETAEKHGLSIEHIKGERQSAKIVLARHAFMADAYQRCGWASLAQIGRAINRDRTTVYYALKKMGVRK